MQFRRVAPRGSPERGLLGFQLSLWESGEKVIKSLFIHHEDTKFLP